MSAPQLVALAALILLGGLALIGVAVELILAARRERRARQQAAWESEIERALRISGGTP